MLVFIISVAVLIPFFLLKRDKTFEKKPTREVIQKEELKAYLNLPHQDAHFDNTLTKSRTTTKPSQSILRDFNPND